MVDQEQGETKETTMMKSMMAGTALIWVMASMTVSGCGGGGSEKELQSLQGVWKLSAVQAEPDDYRWPMREIVITGGKYSVNTGWAQLGRGRYNWQAGDDFTTRKSRSGDIVVDPSENPKQCSFSGFDGKDDKPRLAIYDLGPNTLRLCMKVRDYNSDRPAKPEPGPGVIVYTFTR
jgi:uncharacterized protein (TIGR03067 family)